MEHLPSVLVVDAAGNPKDWQDVETVINYYARNKVAWSSGSMIKVFHGGTNRHTAERTVIEIPSIVATTGPVFDMSTFRAAPVLTRRTLFARDLHICAYCGDAGTVDELTKEHVHPTSRGGKDVWENVVTCCFACNNEKGNLTLAESGLELLYVPYTPNFFETMILKNRRILADQMEFLIGKVGKHSRLHS
jgi:5-methylcytosine-specific restriction endonuclease McrA